MERSRAPPGAIVVTSFTIEVCIFPLKNNNWISFHFFMICQFWVQNPVESESGQTQSWESVDFDVSILVMSSVLKEKENLAAWCLANCYIYAGQKSQKHFRWNWAWNARTRWVSLNQAATGSKWQDWSGAIISKEVKQENRWYLKVTLLKNY